MFKTAADDAVCDQCAPLAGELAEDFNDLPDPPLHPWCRCEIVAIPTVPTVEEQLEFKEEREEDREEEKQIKEIQREEKERLKEDKWKRLLER